MFEHPKHGDATLAHRNPVLAFLAAKWWVGVSVLVALLGTVWAIWGQDPQPPNPLERKLAYLYELSLDDPGSYLTVESGSTYSTTEAIESYRTVIFHDNAVLEVRGSSLSLNALTVEFGTGVQIVANGGQGADGLPGSNGKSGGKCGDGTDGEPGTSGVRGLPGRNVLIQALELRITEGGIRVDTSGGAGGNGGRGGVGGAGGRGSRGDKCGGGNGGQGGKGGNAGAGGDAGDFALRYVNARLGNEARVGHLEHTRVIKAIIHIGTGGVAGRRGAGSNGGIRGAGRGAFVFDSQPAGSAGSNGADGEHAQNGSDGTTSIDRVH